MTMSDAEVYLLHQWVYTRDGGKCRVCGRRDNLHIHHIIFRSQGGTNETSNLITLCLQHHTDVHMHKLTLVGNSNEKVRASNSAFPEGWLI